MALLALLRQKRRRGALLALGPFGAALLYGDGVITPAISVLSSAEGLEVVTPAFKPDVLPSTLLILFLLFFVRKYGTARVGSVFGPIMLVWFGTIAMLGTLEIVRAPAILLALNPWYGVQFFLGARRRQLSCARLGRACRDRGGSALRGHEALRPDTHPPGPFLGRVSCAPAPSSRSNTAAGCRSRSAAASFLSGVPGIGGPSCSADSLRRPRS